METKRQLNDFSFADTEEIGKMFTDTYLMCCNAETIYLNFLSNIRKCLIHFKKTFLNI